MITRRTRIQLLVFVVITLLGVSFVGARSAQLDRLFVDRTYSVVAHFEESGGIFAGAEVTYRGVGVGSVDRMELTEDGVDVYLDIEDSAEPIPADTLAVVGNRSAVGEQYVELQPQTDGAPMLEDGSSIATDETRTPIATETLLGNLSTTVQSVDQDALRTTVSELGQAFSGAGPDLQRIIDTGNSFIETADENFDITTKLIEDSNVVLRGQLASESALRTFASQLSLFSDTLVDADPDLRKIIDDGSFAANQLRTFIEDNEVEFADLLNNLTTTGEIAVRRIPEIEQTLVLYPYIVEGAFTVVSKSPDTGLFDAHFGAIITDIPLCRRGYDVSEQRPPQDRGNKPMDMDAGCTEPPTMSNPRGAQNLPPRVGPDYDSPVVGSYDPDTGRFTWGDRADRLQSSRTSEPPASLGEDSWKWLYLQPMMGE